MPYILLILLLLGILGLNESWVVFSHRSTMRNGDILTINQSLVSPEAKFELGFLSQDSTTSSSYALAISYKNLPKNNNKTEKKTIVWEAPPPSSTITKGISNSSYLYLSLAGDLILMASNSTRLWNSNTGEKGVDMAALLDNGNLVLTAKNESVWESFQNPTDTILPTQSLNLSFKPPLTSNAGKFVFDVIYNGIYLTNKEVLTNTNPYWISQPSNKGSNVTMVFFKEDGTFGFHSTNESSRDYYIPVDYGVGPLRRVKLDPDGNMRMYSWDSNSSIWTIVWQAVLLECEIDGRCGPYGICVYMPQPSCICPLGFHPISDNDMSQGCAPNIKLNCNTSIIVPLERVDYKWGDLNPNDDGFFPISASDCIMRCLGDCLCLGATYKIETARCWTKFSLKNGYQSFEQTVNIFFLKVSSLDRFVAPNWSVTMDLLESNFSHAVDTLWSPLSLDQIVNPAYEMATYVVSSVGTLELLLLLLALYLFWQQRSGYLFAKAQMASLEEMTGAPSSFSFQELVAATNNFSQCLGTGAFASVYKGVINKAGECLEVAVKKLEYEAKGSEKQFRTEVMTIGKVHHVNLVRLYGFCFQPLNRLLVYECMPNGSLDRFLLAKKDEKAVLDWQSRFTIAVGTARGIAYLHEGCRECILHCDIKPENILLDANFQPKVSDFGLAKLIDKDRLPPNQRNNKMVPLGVPTTIRGTPGYMAPEWLNNQLGHNINDKVDVYSFGIVLLELVVGRQNSRFTAFAVATDYWHMPTWARLKLDGGRLVDIVDPSLQLVNEEDLTQVERFVKLALLCIDNDPLTRPSMTKVVQMLEGTLEVPYKSSEVPQEITRSDIELARVRSIQLQMQYRSEITSHQNPYPSYPLLPYIGSSYSIGEPSGTSYAASELSQPR